MKNWIVELLQRAADKRIVSRLKSKGYTPLGAKIFKQRSWLECKVDDAIYESNKKVR